MGWSDVCNAQKEVGESSAKVGQGNAMRNKWVKKDGNYLVPAVDEVDDTTRKTLQQVRTSKTVSDPKVLADYKKRKMVTLFKVITYKVTKGPKYAKEIPVEVTDLTADMLASGEWQTANFKPYNFNALGASQNAGALHPLNKVRKEFRDIFFHVGFVEMPTSRYVFSLFWFTTLVGPLTKRICSQLRRVWFLELRLPLRTTTASRP